MIKFTEKIKQDFLPIEWIKRLQDSGIELIDSKYFIIQKDGEEYIETKENLPSIDESISITPTYTLSLKFSTNFQNMLMIILERCTFLWLVF